MNSLDLIYKPFKTFIITIIIVGILHWILVQIFTTYFHIYFCQFTVCPGHIHAVNLQLSLPIIILQYYSAVITNRL